MSFNTAVVVDGHVSWSLLTTAEQAELEANYPHQDGIADGDAQFEAWLDTAYLLRHANDNIADDPFV